MSDRNQIIEKPLTPALKISIAQLTALSLEHPNLPITRTSDELVAYYGAVRISFTVSRDYKRLSLELRLGVLGYFNLGVKPLPDGLKAGQAQGFELEGMWYLGSPLRGVDLLASPAGAQIRLLWASPRESDYRPLQTDLCQMDHGNEYVAAADAVLDVGLRLCHEL